MCIFEDHIHVAKQIEVLSSSESDWSSQGVTKIRSLTILHSSTNTITCNVQGAPCLCLLGDVWKTSRSQFWAYHSYLHKGALFYCYNYQYILQLTLLTPPWILMLHPRLSMSNLKPLLQQFLVERWPTRRNRGALGAHAPFPNWDRGHCPQNFQWPIATTVIFRLQNMNDCKFNHMYTKVKEMEDEERDKTSPGISSRLLSEWNLRTAAWKQQCCICVAIMCTKACTYGWCSRGVVSCSGSCAPLPKWSFAAYGWSSLWVISVLGLAPILGSTCRVWQLALMAHVSITLLWTPTVHA